MKYGRHLLTILASKSYCEDTNQLACIKELVVRTLYLLSITSLVVQDFFFFFLLVLALDNTILWTLVIVHHKMFH